MRKGINSKRLRAVTFGIGALQICAIGFGDTIHYSEGALNSGDTLWTENNYGCTRYWDTLSFRGLLNNYRQCYAVVFSDRFPPLLHVEEREHVHGEPRGNVGEFGWSEAPVRHNGGWKARIRFYPEINPSTMRLSITSAQPYQVGRQGNCPQRIDQGSYKIKVDCSTRPPPPPIPEPAVSVDIEPDEAPPACPTYWDLIPDITNRPDHDLDRNFPGSQHYTVDATFLAANPEFTPVLAGKYYFYVGNKTTTNPAVYYFQRVGGTWVREPCPGNEGLYPRKVFTIIPPAPVPAPHGRSPATMWNVEEDGRAAGKIIQIR